MKKIELQALVCGRCLLAVEKDGTVWVQLDGIGTPQKSKNANKDAGVA